MMKNLLLFTALIAALSGSAQRIHGYAKAKISGQEAFQLNDSTEVFAERTDRGFTVRKRVWVANSSLSKGVIMPGSALFNERGEVCEGTITNIFAEAADGMLLTPPLTSGLLPAAAISIALNLWLPEQID